MMTNYFSPVLLKQSGGICLYVDQDGSVFGLSKGGRFCVAEIPQTLSPLGFDVAKQMLEGCSLTFDGVRIRVNVGLQGGGGNHSKDGPKVLPSRSASSAPPSKTSVQQAVADLAVANSIAPASPPTTTWSIPPKNGVFVGREPLLAEMKQRLMDGRRAPFAQVNIVGLGGVGKTCLVREYLDRNPHYPVVAWISGEQPMGGYRELGERLGIVKSSDEGNEALEIVRGWLEQNSDWVVVFDNVDDFSVIAPFLPSEGQGGHVITTSRNPHKSDSLVVGLFSPTESVDLLAKITLQNGGEKGGELAEALGHLPLAITQAAAYMRETGTSFAVYLDIFQDARVELWKDEKAPKGYPLAVGKTWNISIKRLGLEMPQAVGVLNSAAYLAPDNIPKMILLDSEEGEMLLLQCLHRLQKYSLFTVGQKEGTYSVHRLVQAATRDNLFPPDEKKVLKGLLNRFQKEWEFGYEATKTWDKARLLQPHLASFCDYGVKEEDLSLQVAFFLNEVGNYQSVVEINISKAMKSINTSLEVRKKVLGEQHPAYAQSLNNLGMVYLDKGGLTSAIPLFNQALAIRRAALGSKNVEVADTLNNLGGAHKSLGQLPQSIDYFKEALEIYRKNKGENDPTVAKVWSNLASLYKNQGNYTQAIEFYTKSLAIRTKVYGQLNVNVTHDLNGLGTVYEDMRNFPLAIRYYTQCLEIKEKMFGEQHPAVALILNNLGSVSLAQGKFVDALGYFNRSLQIREKCYGPEHPTVAESLNQLGGCYSSQDYPQKDLVLAIDYYNRSILIKRKVYGEGHPAVADSLHNLGSTYLDQGDLLNGISCLKQASAIYKGAYSHPHPDVATNLEILGVAYQTKGELSEAIRCNEQALAIRKKIDGGVHPNLATCLNNLGKIYLSSKDFEKAIDYFKQAMDILSKCFEKDHPHIALCHTNLGWSYFQRGDFPQAIDHFTKAINILQKHYGPDHPALVQPKKGIEAAKRNLGQMTPPPKRVDPFANDPRVQKGVQLQEQASKKISNRGDLDEAILTLNTAMDLYEQVYGEQVNQPTADSLKLLGHILIQKGQYREALTTFDFYQQMHRALNNNREDASIVELVRMCRLHS